MKYLGIDVGTRRSGIAFADSKDDILFSLKTFNHKTEDELFLEITRLVTEKQIDEVVLGNPLLLSGEAGKQSGIVLALAQRLSEVRIPYSLCDERYTSNGANLYDKDAAAACEILAVKLNLN